MNNEQNKCSINQKKNVVDERFEQNAGVKIYNKDSYSGGSGFYSIKQNAKCPNVNDNESAQQHNLKKR